MWRCHQCAKGELDSSGTRSVKLVGGMGDIREANEVKPEILALHSTWIECYCGCNERSPVWRRETMPRPPELSDTSVAHTVTYTICAF
jgi:hypothetical protein